MMNFNYESYKFYFDLLAFCLLLVPLYYFVKGETARRTIMTLGSAYVMYFIAARLVVFYLIYWIIVFLLQRMIAALEKRGGSGLLFGVSIVIALLPMIAWKVFGDGFNIFFNIGMNALLKPVSQSLWEIDMAQNLLTPIGISFAAFRAVDLIIKTFLGKLEGLSFGRVMFYGFFAPVQVVGPISEYEETQKQDQKPDPQNIYNGLVRIAFGFIKVFLLSSVFSASAAVIAQPQGLPVLHIWLGLFAYSWYFYLNFSGYSDVAIGIARLFGYTLKENFNFPLLLRRNVQEYWANWHMGLTRFAQRNIFIPCGGYRARTQYVALFMTMMVIALWHGLNMACIVFGLYHAFGLIANRLYAKVLGEKRVPGKAETAFYCVLTYVYVSLAYPMIMAPGLKEALPFYKALVGM